MKKHTEKPPIDDLFARKLGSMSLPPSADGFERLQARMKQQETQTRVVFWRNPAIQQYMALAACLVLVCLLGWLYWPSGSVTDSTQSQVAVNHKPKPQVKPSGQKQQNALQTKSATEEETPVSPDSDIQTDQVALSQETGSDKLQQKTLSNPPAENTRTSRSVPSKPEEFVAQTKPADSKSAESKRIVDVPTSTSTGPVEPTAKEQLAEAKPATKPAPVSERVLDVTIAEPQTLVAARQEVKALTEEKAVMAHTDKVEKEAKGNIWQQVKRIKQGEVFARQDNVNNEDRGLLERAYSGLKHSLDKDKSAKQ